MVTSAAVAKVLGGVVTTGRRPHGTDLALARAVRDGLPFAALEN